MEADLQAHYGIDYRDRWRGDLTLRRLFVLISHLPPTSNVAAIPRGGRPHWSIEAHLLDNLRMVQTGTKEKPAEPHPLRFEPKRLPASRIADGQRRRAERLRLIEAGEIA